jgi:hypothetical protein
MPWLGSGKAVLGMWCPRDTGGYATANVLLGETEPADRGGLQGSEAVQAVSAEDLQRQEGGYEDVGHIDDLAELEV